ncbi:pilus assembly PilX N-terminal domain-containing protein [Clostridium taeniosporum]|uniref:Uncharacterized protein n=1 Tax=Clostridium taeniosporum TaxID=394958 RepID=A0A1D7XMN0_9CLOT|nr:pilus assembly PilX N-terminal domain-containing protein [Clostridium taeniosporum]AOR24623.1 hypothetical protein BGI42_13125 [Clostridium taeniosporum]
MRKKKRGSSLITVVIIFTILITVGTAMLSMTVGDYKMRIKESRRVQNLYAADSGLDVAYDIIVKTFDEAVQFGDFKARQLKVKDNRVGPNAELYEKAENELDSKIKSIDTDHKNHNNGTGRCKCSKRKKEAQKKFAEEVKRLTEAEFKRCFKVFLKRDSDAVSEKEYIPKSVLGQSICNNSYINMNLEEKDVSNILLNKKQFSNNKKIEFKDSNSIPKLFVCEDSKVNELNKLSKYDSISNDIKDNFNGITYNLDNNTFKVKVTSTFIDKGKSNEITKNNLRIVQAIFKVKVPNYEDVTFKESNIVINPDTTKYGQLLVGGNMKVKGNDSVNKVNLNINGDIFVQGNKEIIKNKVYDKYKGGISLNNSNVEFNGDVSTASTFLIEDNTNVNINENDKPTEKRKTGGNLYALNVYVGKVEKGKYVNEFGGNSSLNINNGSVLVDNDLALKAYNTNIKIKNFYGLNDKNISDNNKDFLKNPVRTSSSIIVNGNKNSGVEITDEAYIMGVAHIDGKKEPYQTAESISIKGNYIAYATDQNNPYNIENYYSKNIQEKDEIFTTYWNCRKELVNTGGIKLPDNKNSIHTIGAIVYRDKDNNPHIDEGSYTIDDSTKIKNKRLEYAQKVYNLNQSKSQEDISYFQNLYNNNGNNANPVENIMNLYNIPEDYDINKQKEKAKKAIFNNDSNKVIVIKSKDLNYDENDYKYYDNEDKQEKEAKDKIIIEVSSGEVLDIFIATNSRVYIEGNVHLRGNIITEDDLIIRGSGQKNIEYNQDIINKIYEENIELFNLVFSNNKNQAVEKTFLNVDYDLNKFLDNRLWKIIK